MNLPNYIICASGSGSGAEELILASRKGIIKANPVAIICNNPNAGVIDRAKRLGVKVILISNNATYEDYQKIFKQEKADYIFLSGYLRLVPKPDPVKTHNVHPALLPKFGGKGMYGIKVHEEVMRAFHAGEVDESGFTMHRVNEKYDEGDIYFRFHTRIDAKFTPHDLGAHVNKFEHKYQPIITNLIITGKIRFENGKLVGPEGYTVDWYEKDEGVGGRNEMLFRF